MRGRDREVAKAGADVCMQVGVLKARAVASAHGLPLVPVHHMEAHALVARLTGGGDDPGADSFSPALA